MDAEKQKWLDEVGVKKLAKPFTHYDICDDAYPTIMHYSTQYLEETPLETLKEARERRINFKAGLGREADANP